MKAWICESCGAQIKQENKPRACLLCNRRHEFTEVEVKENKDEATQKYEEAIKKLEEYEEGAPKKKLSNYCSYKK